MERKNTTAPSRPHDEGGRTKKKCVMSAAIVCYTVKKVFENTYTKVGAE